MQRTTLILLFFLAIGSLCHAQTGNDSTSTVMPTLLTKEYFNSNIADISKKEWKYLGDKPAIIDFYADWCAPCRAMSPVLEEIATKYQGKLHVYKIDTEAEKELAAMFRVRAIPYLLFIPVDASPQFLEGAVPKNYLEDIVREYLLKE